MSPAVPIDFSLPENYPTEAGVTALYPNRGNNFYYAAMGLSGECGEGGIAAIEAWDTHDELGLGADQYIKELGDILWYLAAVCHELGLDLLETFSDAKHDNICFDCCDRDTLLHYHVITTAAAGRVIEHAKKAMRDDAGKITTWRKSKIRPELIQCARFWCVCCYIVGCPPEEVARRNIEKLRDRQQRGVLHGDGDNR